MFDGAVDACCCDRLLVRAGCARHVDYPMSNGLYRIDSEDLSFLSMLKYMIREGVLVPVEPDKVSAWVAFQYHKAKGLTVLEAFNLAVDAALKGTDYA